MSSKVSKGLEDFLDYLRETAEQCRIADADRVDMEAATQDLLHALELGEDKATERARIGLKLREIRRKRRTAKDIAEQSRPVTVWAEQNRAVVKALERLLGDVRKLERKSENRAYAPRTSVLDEIKRKEAGT